MNRSTTTKKTASEFNEEFDFLLKGSDKQHSLAIGAKAKEKEEKHTQTQ